ncbi:dihydrodipicolinate synthase family protein [Nocardia arthritidis]|uniref:Dihydrodipicolinate synthase family protein n=1 Tax=Nocardia arthritidis TaxID=228602 RepID=A0A6G9YEG8_9NOCA|nr:dihydrodipicolinate synthase family protein [Nocardia arthritidis]QIS11520.1 hypothetical protein F5544_18230 [Nocardia arthritidis]
MTGRLLDFTGSLVALVTPFNADGGIDYGALSELVALHEESGTSGLFFLGVAGEGATLSDAEFAEFVRRVLEPRRRIPHLIGCTGRYTRDAIDRVALAAEYGADGAILTVPANMGPDQAQAASYFREVADHSAIPIGTFNNPARLITDLDTATLLEIFEHPAIELHKEGSPRTGQIGEILAARPKVCFLADDSPEQDILVTAMSLGARGIANATGNLVPGELAALARPWTSTTDLDTFRALFPGAAPDQLPLRLPESDRHQIADERGGIARRASAPTAEPAVGHPGTSRCGLDEGPVRRGRRLTHGDAAHPVPAASGGWAQPGARRHRAGEYDRGVGFALCGAVVPTAIRWAERHRPAEVGRTV